MGMDNRIGRIIDGKPRVFDICDYCKSEVEFICTYDGTMTGDVMKDPDISGSYRCGNCGSVSYSDFIPRIWIHRLFNSDKTTEGNLNVLYKNCK